MRVTVPHMGNLHISVKAIFNKLDVELIMPPVNNQHTLSLGARYSPEGLCIPFKMTLGNLIEAAEMGADALLAPGGYGICRLGYYTKVQQQILAELGYNIEIIRWEYQSVSFMVLWKVLSMLPMMHRGRRFFHPSGSDWQSLMPWIR